LVWVEKTQKEKNQKGLKKPFLVVLWLWEGGMVEKTKTPTPKRKNQKRFKKTGFGCPLVVWGLKKTPKQKNQKKGLKKPVLVVLRLWVEKTQ
jgi:hypothetical protein